MTKKTLVFALLPLLTLLPMCGGSSQDDSALPTGPSASGSSAADASSGVAVQKNLRVFLTDKPSEEYSEVWVSVKAVRVHQSADAGEAAAGWQELPVTAAMPVDLLVLRNGVLLGLCNALLPAGHYQQVRLVLTPNSGSEPPFNDFVVAGGVSHPIDVPSGTIKIVHQFTVDVAQVTDLTLDFDASQSIKMQGNGKYFMQPVIKANN